VAGRSAPGRGFLVTGRPPARRRCAAGFSIGTAEAFGFLASSALVLGCGSSLAQKGWESRKTRDWEGISTGVVSGAGSGSGAGAGSGSGILLSFWAVGVGEQRTVVGRGGRSASAAKCLTPTADGWAAGGRHGKAGTRVGLLLGWRFRPADGGCLVARGRKLVYTTCVVRAAGFRRSRGVA
jgi:hypothetical protein